MELEHMMVSVIIPVYNVEKYVSECIDSLIAQTHKNLEIICIDDASLDGSYEICKGFEDVDSRVKVYRNSCNMGLGYTRNSGVSVSNGNFIFFVDSDDWLPSDAIKELLTKAIQEDADICVGAMSHYNQITNEYYVGWRDVNDEFALKTYLNWSMCNKLYKSSFYKGNCFKQYEGIYEDAATYPIIMKLAQKVSLLKEVTYYYRRFSGKSIMDDWKKALGTQGAIEYMVSSFLERNHSTKDLCLYNAAFTLIKSSLQQLKGAVKENKCQEEVYGEFKDKMENCLKELFPDYCYGEVSVFGSSNLNRIFRNFVLEYCPNELATPIYNFSSIISMGSGTNVHFNIFHEKVFRKNMLEKDWLKLFWRDNNFKIKYLLMDFIDERYDIIEKDGYFYTRSEAFEEAYFDGEIEPYSIIKRSVDQCDKLWEIQCRKFVEKINFRWPDCKIILFELYLTDSYGTEVKRTKWQNQTYIKGMNDVLKKYYLFLKGIAKNLVVISPRKDKMYTDEKFVYGCYPWFYNNDLYIELTEKVNEVIYG